MAAYALPFRSLICASAAALAIVGCSDRHAPSAPANETAAHTDPRTAPLPEEEGTAPQEAIKAALPMGNVAATYVAAFEEGQLKRITEERKPAGVAPRRADYVFHGARLMEYSGAALRSDATVELRFDMQGALLSGTGSAGKPDDAEIKAVRARAQLLRSHALARKAVRGHGAREIAAG